MTTHPPRDAELLLQLLQTQRSMAALYRAAVPCAVDGTLRADWKAALRAAERRVETIREILTGIGVDQDTEGEGRSALEYLCHSLLRTIQVAADTSPPEVAQLVAAECVFLLESKDHLSWQMLGELARSASCEQRELFREAHTEMLAERGERFQEAASWARELWRKELGIDCPAVEAVTWLPKQNAA